MAVMNMEKLAQWRRSFALTGPGVVLAMLSVLLAVPAVGEAGQTVPPATWPVFKRVLQIDSARYTGPGTTTLFQTKTISVTISVKADDLHDTMLVYATNRPCARTYDAAVQQTIAIGQATGGNSELTDVDLGLNPGAGASVRRTGRFSYRYRLTNPQTAVGMKSVCAMLYDASGDPRYPGNPHAIPARHVWQRTNTTIR